MIEDNGCQGKPSILTLSKESRLIAKQAKVGIIGAELGAVHKLDLTTDVTHLLIGSVDSEKYRHVAKRRPDILVLQPEWLFAVRDAWMQGDEIDLNPRQRQWIEATAKDNGAQYHGDLTRAVTHLIAADPKGAKYDRAKQWSIKIVSLEWFDRSLERRMILDESTFDPLIEQGKRGEGAYQPQVKRPTTGKRGRTDETDSGTVNAKRKLRRTASARLSSQSQNMWQDITTTEGQASFLEDSWTQSVDPERRPPEPTVETQPIPEGLSRSLSNMANSKALFAGWTCLIHGHSAQVSSKLRQLLSDNGASIVDRADMLKDPTIDWSAVILPSAWTGKPDSVVPQVPLETKQVTEWWVERCLAHKTILDPDKDVFSQAMLHVPGNCLQDLFISASGFGQDVRYVARIVQAAGGSYEEGVTRKVNLLIFKHSNDLDKPVYCAERNIDVVSPEWFFSSLREGRAQPVYPFMLPRHLCDAIQQIINSRRRSDTQGDAKKDGNQKT
ncbi:hypothetical protein ANO11243_086650 [Dothideomycetidae sp. 11243]|nr:hypothetical protein ANO11243_086650 [fungal sp. No.11243]